MKFYKLKIFLLLSAIVVTSCSSRKISDENKMVTPSGLRYSIPKNGTGETPASVIYHSTDAGETWMPYANGIPEDATVSAFLVEGDIIFATTDYHGIYSIRKGEKQWYRIDRNLPEKVDINAITSTGYGYVIGTFRHGILISKNNGSHWSYPSIPIKNTSVRCLLTTKKLLLAGTDNGIYRSMDHGNTWKLVYDGVQVNGFTEMNNKIYAAMMNGAMMTDENGTDWKYIYKEHTLHDISNDGESVYAMVFGGGLLKSSNDRFWENVNRGLGTLNVYTFEVKKFNNKIFAAQHDGIYQSGNGGKSWRIIKNGLPDSTAFLTLETTTSGLIAGIGGRKKWPQTTNPEK